MGYRSTKQSLRKLQALSQGQGGYFTAQQAGETGYRSPHLDYHVHAGNFERAGSGLYRLPEIPLAEHDDLIRLAFWSRNRADEIQAIASHQTALAYYGLSDLLPTTVQLTVPKPFRKAAPPGVVLVKRNLAPADWQEGEGFRVTTPLRTLIDCAASETISSEHLEQAVRQALERGLVRKSQLEANRGSLPENSRLSAALRQLA